jgi:hypothetical protein
MSGFALQWQGWGVAQRLFDLLLKYLLSGSSQENVLSTPALEK